MQTFLPASPISAILAESPEKFLLITISYSDILPKALFILI